MDPKLILASLGLAALAGCAVTPVGSLCTAGPVILDSGASQRLTRSEKEQIVALNASGEAICGWKRPR